MKNGDKTKEELLNEMMELRQRNVELEKSELQCRQVKNKLRDSEKMYRTLYDENPSIYYTVDAGGVVLSINNFGAEQLGYRVGELVGQSVLKVIYEDDKKNLFQQIAECLREPGHIATNELRKIRKDGSLLWVKEVARAVNAVEGNIVFIVCEDITERKRTEEALSQSEEKYRILVDNIQDGVFLLQDAKFQLANEAGARMVGYTAKEIIGKDFREFVAPEHLEMIVDNYYRRLAGEKVPKEYEFCGLHRDGKTKVFVNVTVGLINYHGRVASIGTVKDITERKRMEETLRKAYDELEMRVKERTAELAEANESLKIEISERRRAEERIRFQTIVLSQVNDAVVAFDNNHRIIYWNNGAERLYNFKSGEVLGRKMEEVTRHRWFKSEDETAAYDSLAETGFWRGEFIQARKNGEELHVEASITTLKNEKDAAIGSISVMRDITERKRTEEALQQSEEKYRMLIDNMQDGVFIIQDSKMQFVNKAFARTAGYTVEEILGRRFIDFIAPEDKERVMDNYSRRLAGENVPKEYEFNVLHKDGTRIIMNVNVGLITYRGRIASMGTIKDITERKRAEEERERWMAELARSNAELEQFAYVASHDLKEPLRMVSSFAQLLQKRYKERLGEDADEFIAYIVEGIIRMQAIINDLLAYSRVGTQGKPFQPTDCESVLNQVTVNLKVAIEQSGAVVTHDPMPTITADTSQMIQLLQNLISNAIKFRGKELPRVHVTAKKKENEWVFSVRDNGIGIAPEFFGRLFQIFQRGHPASEYAGTGIGLATCKKIVERHGGKIWAESVEGRGSTFYFTIPMRN